MSRAERKSEKYALRFAKSKGFIAVRFVSSGLAGDVYRALSQIDLEPGIHYTGLPVYLRVVGCYVQFVED